MASSVLFDPLPNPPVPLPQVPGPKLDPFTPTAYAGDIEFMSFLGRENDKDSYVWMVKIDGEGPYALKMFFFSNWEYLRDVSPGCSLIRPLANPQLYIDYFDAFNCECRVYGRLKDEGREDLAVKAYGYLLLTAEQETVLAKIILGSDYDYNPHEACDGLDDFNPWGRWEQHRTLPIRAIVKQLVDNNPFQTSQLGNLWPDLEQLHKLGILVCDVHEGNYLGGKLVDFSRALTMYHPCLDQVRPLILRGFRKEDPEGLENTLIAWYQCNPWEPSIDALESLQRFVGGYGSNGNYGHDPRDYDWRKTEESVEIADAYVAEELFADEEYRPRRKKASWSVV